MAARKPKIVTVTIKPWYQTQLAAAAVGALIGLAPFIYGKIQDNDIKRDTFGLTFLGNTPPGPFTFTNNKKNSFSARLGGFSATPSDSWILINQDGKEQRFGRGNHIGQFWVYLDNLACDGTYYYRTEAMREGRIAVGQMNSVFLPACSTASDIEKIERDPRFLSDPRRLMDPGLPPTHPIPGGFGDEIHKSPLGPNR